MEENRKPITFELHEEAEDWVNEHCRHCHSRATAGEHFVFEFMPTGLGTFTTVRCIICGEEFECNDL